MSDDSVMRLRTVQEQDDWCGRCGFAYESIGHIKHCGAARNIAAVREAQNAGGGRSATAKERVSVPSVESDRLPPSAKAPHE